MVKMLVISRTYHKLSEEGHVHEDACLLRHTDVLVLLLVACAASTWICAGVASGWTPHDYMSFLVVQYCFCVLACPAVVLAMHVESGIFFSHRDADKRSKLLVQVVFATVMLETLFVFYFYV
jgi:F0F1-type ATP synthase membrane subunit c/vacuolar-type H+-ATPase subunit K